MDAETDAVLKTITGGLISLIATAGFTCLMGWLPIFAGWSFWQCFGAIVLARHIIRAGSSHSSVTVLASQEKRP